MGLLDKILGRKTPDKPADFSDVRSGSSSTALPPRAHAPAPSAPPVPRTYTVVAGDSLSKIAKREYGDGNKWPQIFDANRDKIKNPDMIHPGQVLVIPPLPGTGGR